MFLGDLVVQEDLISLVVHFCQVALANQFLLVPPHLSDLSPQGSLVYQGYLAPQYL